MSFEPLMARAEATPDPRRIAQVGLKAAWLEVALGLGAPVPRGVVAPCAGTIDENEVRRALDALHGGAWQGELVAVRGSPLASDASVPTFLNTPCTRAAAAELAATLGERVARDTRIRWLRSLASASGRAVAGSHRSDEAELAHLESQLAELERLEPFEQVLTAVRALGDVPVLIQPMVLGNIPGCGAGVANSRSPVSGEPALFGEVAWERQGEDLTSGRLGGVALRAKAAGRRRELSLEAQRKDIYDRLHALLDAAERRCGTVVEIEWTLGTAGLSVLQLGPAGLTPNASARVLVDWVQEGRMTVEDALQRAPDLVSTHEVPASLEGSAIGRGLVASPGAVVGRVETDPARAVTRGRAGERVVLVVSDVSPEDAAAVRASVAVVTAAGGLTSHAAVMSRALGRPCVVSVGDLRRAGDGWCCGARPLARETVLTVDGTRGVIHEGALPVVRAPNPSAETLIGWASELEPSEVWMADDGLPNLAARALSSGASGAIPGAAPTWDGAGPLPTGRLVVPPERIGAARIALARMRLAARV